MSRRGRGGSQRTAARDRVIVRGVPQALGDLSGEVVEPIIASFTYFGTVIRVNPDLTETEVVDLLEQAGDVEADGGAAMMQGLKAYVRGHIHADDFDTFWELVKKNRQGTEQVIKVCYKILELLSERPTSPPSDSADGRRTTPKSWPDGASEPDDVGSPSPRPDDRPPAIRRWVDEYERNGRPDLANQIMVTIEAKEAALAQRTG